MLTLAVVLAAGLGAVARYVLDQVVQHNTTGEFPYGTLLVNTSGSLLLGLTVGLAIHQGLLPGPAVVIGAGFLGSYTTLSTWAYETLALAESGALLQAVANVFGSFAVAALAASAGLGLAML
jgi:CrcB protein